MERVGALGHATFGGRLPADARDFPASAMAKKHAGDWRNPSACTGLGRAEIAEALPTARPGETRTSLPGHALWRVLALRRAPAGCLRGS